MTMGLGSPAEPIEGNDVSKLMTDDRLYQFIFCLLQARVQFDLFVDGVSEAQRRAQAM